MHAKNKFVCLIAMLLAAFALPTSAATNTKSITMTVPASLSASASVQQIPVSVNNTGNSNGNSFEVDWSVSSSFAVQSCQIGSGTPVTPKAGLTGTGYKGCTFLQQLPNKSSVTVTLNVVVTAACAASSVTWNAFSWTGAPGPASQSFAIASLGTYFTPLPQVPSGTCKLGFVTEPMSATVNTTITSVPYNPTGAKVQVGLFNGNTLDTTFTGSVSLALTSGTGTAGAVLSGGGSVSAVSGVANFPSLSIGTVGVNYQLTASSSGFTVDSTQFWITDTAGTVGCLDTNNYVSTNGVIDPNKTYVDLDTSSSGDYGIRRGPNWDDQTGTNCIYKVGVHLASLGTNSVQFLFDKTTGQNGAFKYTVVWDPVTVDQSGSTAAWTDARPLVSWGNDINGAPVYVPALACADDDLTQPPASIMPVLPSVDPFIGSAGTASDITAGATGTNPGAYLAGGGKLARMCVAQHGWISDGFTTDGKIQVIYWDKFVDEADSTVKLP